MGNKKGSHLVPVKKMVTRGGKTFETTVLVNPNKKNTVTNKKTTIPLEKWAKIRTIDDFEKARKDIFKYDDVARKDIHKEEFVDFLERSGVHWDRSENFAVDYMRAMTKAKLMIKEGRFVAHDANSNEPRPENPFQKVPKADARKLCQKYKKIVSYIIKDEKDKYKDEDAYLEETLKLYNIAWNKCDHKGVNHMRMMMALREAIEEGRETPISHSVGENPDYQKYKDYMESKKANTLDKKREEVKQKIEYPSWKSPKNLVPFKVKQGKLGEYRVYEGDIPFPEGLKPPEMTEKEPRPNDFNGSYDDPEFLKAWNAWDKKYDEFKKEREEYAKKINDLVEKNLNRPLLFKTDAEIKQWAKSIGIKIDKKVLDNLDKRAWVDLAPAIEEMMEKFPQIRNFTYKDWKTGEVKTEPLTIHFSNAKGCFMQGGNGGLWVTPLMNDYGTTLRHIYRGFGSNFNQRGDGTYKAVVRHECGHVLETMILQDKIGYEFIKPKGARKGTFNIKYKNGDKDYGTIHQEYNKMKDTLVKKAEGHSKYSQTNGNEVFAESFTALMSGQHNEFAGAMKKFLTEWGVL